MLNTIIDVNTECLDNLIKYVSHGVYQSNNGLLKSTFLKEQNKVVFESGYNKITWIPKTISYFSPLLNKNDVIYFVQDAPLEVKNTYARYNRTTPDIDDWFLQFNDQLKHQILVQGFQRNPKPWFTGDLEFVVSGSLTLEPTSLVVVADGIIKTSKFETTEQIDIVDIDGNIVFNLPKVVAYDSAIPTRAMTYGKYKCDFGSDGSFLFDIVLDNAWMTALERVYPIVIDPTIVVSSAYDTSGNGGRKLVRLSNGWLVSCVLNTSTDVIYFYKSTDNGTTWTQICYLTQGSYTFNYTITYNNTVINVMYTSGDTQLRTVNFDATTQTNIEIASLFVKIDESQTSLATGVSLTRDSSGYLHSTWCSKNATYPNSFNIRYSKSSNGGTSWDTPTQITTLNSSTTQLQNPCIVIRSDNTPLIVIEQFNTTAYEIWANYYSGGTWLTANSGKGVNIYSATSYVQKNTSAVVKKSGSNIGRIWCAWQGYASGNPSTYHVYAKYSDNSGSTWSTLIDLGVGQNVQLSENSAGDIYAWYDLSGDIVYRKCSNGTTTFATAVTFHDGTTDSNPQAMEYESGSMLGVVWKDSSKINFDKLLFNQPPNAPTGLIRTNFDASANAIFTWTYSDPDPSNTQSAYQVQIIRVSDSVTVVDTGKVSSTTSSYTLTGSTIANNVQYQWKVKTWDNSDSAGPYSDVATFRTSAKPTTTITYPATNGDTVPQSNLTVTWSFSDPESEGQSAYQIKLTDNSDNVLNNSGNVADISSRSKTIAYTLVNGNYYKVKVTTWDYRDVASTEVVRTFYVSFTPPATPTITTTSDNYRGSITINITNPTPSGSQPDVNYNDVYRKASTDSSYIRIATSVSNNGSYIDYTPASDVTYQYYVVAVGDNGTMANSSVVNDSVSLSSAQLALVSDYAQWIELKLDANRTEHRPKESALMLFSGRTEPVREFSEFEQLNIDSSYTLQSKSEVDTLRALCDAKQILLYRDARGRREFVTIDDVSINDRFRPTLYTVSFNPVRTYFNEVV